MPLIYRLRRYGYQLTGNGRWISLALKRPKQKAGGKKRKQQVAASKQSARDANKGESDQEKDPDEYNSDDEVRAVMLL